MRDFRSVRRRFDVLFSDERLAIVDDYAHHPTAVRATIAAARGYHEGELVVAFQPHRYTRTAFLARDFAEALLGADRVYLHPVYAASEPAIPGVSERSIGEVLRTIGGAVNYVASVEAIRRRLFEDARPRALLLMLGAGDITDVAARLRAGRAVVRGTAAARMSVTTARACTTLLRPGDRDALHGIFGARARFDEPLAAYTSWKIGGPADALVTAQTEDELAQFMRFCLRRRMPWWVLGNGSNVLIGDGGIRGVVLRLAGEFSLPRLTYAGR